VAALRALNEIASALIGASSVAQLERTWAL
jgi:hypothetical protein